MKKRFIPTLILLTGLVACGGTGNDGIVKNGVAYKDGAAANVNSDVRQSVEGKVAKVKTTTSQKTKTVTSVTGEKQTQTESSNTNYTFDFVNETIEYRATSSSSSSGKSRTSFKAKKQSDGSFTYVSGGEVVSSVLDEATLSLAYNNMKNTTIYSWSYNADASSILGEAGASGSSLFAGLDLSSLTGFMNTIYANTKISGDPSTGSFEVGIEKAFDITLDLSSLLEDAGELGEYSSMISLLGLSSIPMTIKKMKTVYKDGLIRSTVSEADYKMDMGALVLGASATATYTSSTSYTYEMKK